MTKIICVKEDDRVEIDIDGHGFTATAKEWFFAIKMHSQYMQALAELQKLAENNVLEIINDYIAVNNAEMSKMFFADKWGIPLVKFEKIAYAILREQEEHRWIPVSERLPELRQWVLCYWPDDVHEPFSITQWWEHTKREHEEISFTYWQPIILPEQEKPK